MKYFSTKEILNAGSSPELLTDELKKVLDYFAGLMKLNFGAKVYVILLKNGLTSGQHASPEHREGKAVDFVIINKTGKSIRAYQVTQMMSYAGFRSCGAYYNGVAWSFHGDVGDRFRQWFWDKREKNNIKKLSLYNNFLTGSL